MSVDFSSLLAAVKKFCEITSMCKNETNLFQGYQKSRFFSASLLVDCNLAFPLNKMSSGVSTLYIEKFVLNSTL